MIDRLLGFVVIFALVVLAAALFAIHLLSLRP